ncbi:MAG TPA: hypothetical protein VFW69_17925 [Mycobacterium sp.]|nr:hypothetical protein [Mycobacterium sp.]
MTVTVIQIGLDPDLIDYSSPEFTQFTGLSKEVLRAANDDNVAGLRAAGYQVDNCLIDFGADIAHATQPDCRFVFNQAAQATPGDIRRWHPEPEGAIR